MEINNDSIKNYSPIDNGEINVTSKHLTKTYSKVIKQAKKSFKMWRSMPAPKRGEIIRQIGMGFRQNKITLSKIISYETGKPIQESLGEVQEMVDICDFACGQSRMLYGVTTVSEREDHRLYDQYHPLGIIGVLTAFNFPGAVWAWNAMIAAVCGDVVVWKPSSKAITTALSIQSMIDDIMKMNDLPEGIFSVVVGKGSEVGEKMIKDKRIPLISFTGSTDTGRHVSEVVAARFGKTILELGGNNAVILTPSADLELAIPSVVFGAVGTTGQRCTTIRRLIVHESIINEVEESLVEAYKSLKIGNPLDESNHVGTLIDEDAVVKYKEALVEIEKQGGVPVFKGEALNGCYVHPAIYEMKNNMPIVQKETFVPILYVIKYKDNVSNAIKLQNAVKQGLSSAIFTNDVKEMEEFLSSRGSDCGIANVNMGTSGAEIGGAFGGEKETGGGREAGSDSWKAYMRRQTVGINYGSELPLAQGIKFNI